ncbi:MAG: hypothetical protein HUK19_02555 [Fibrobacter sp.]|nr:hypothetical protein [Fibrobacter sp.]
MKFKLLALAAAFSVGQAFAYFGFGVHYAPAFDAKLKSSGGYSDVTPQAIKDKNTELLNMKIEYEHDGMEAPIIHGLGFKIWVDSLTVVDFEATVNLQYGSYDARLLTTVNYPNPSDPTVVQKAVNEKDLQIDMSGTPFGVARPKFVTMNGDLSVTYAFLTNLVTVVRPYVGGGLSVFMNTFVMDDDFIEDLMNDEDLQKVLLDNIGATEDGDATAEKNAQLVKDKIKQQAKKQTLNYSIGGHVLLGARIRFPYIPVAAYINGKYYIGGDFPEQVSTNRLAAEAGIGLSF